MPAGIAMSWPGVSVVNAPFAPVEGAAFDREGLVDRAMKMQRAALSARCEPGAEDQRAGLVGERRVEDFGLVPGHGIHEAAGKVGEGVWHGLVSNR
jgi:hypothetical protein